MPASTVIERPGGVPVSVAMLPRFARRVTAGDDDAAEAMATLVLWIGTYPRPGPPPEPWHPVPGTPDGAWYAHVGTGRVGCERMAPKGPGEPVAYLFGLPDELAAIGADGLPLPPRPAA